MKNLQMKNQNENQSNAFVELSDVIKLYETDIKTIKIAALRGIELSIDKGSLVEIMGPSGSGKTTLIKTIGGIEPPSSGTIRVGDRIVNNLKQKHLINYRRYEVGFIWQLPQKNLVPQLSVLKNIFIPMRIAHLYTRQERIKKANELLNAIGLSNKRNQSANKLSGGEAQRVALAVALANNQKLVLADEPTDELDSNNASRIIEYIKELNKMYNQTFIVVTHDNRFASMTELTYKIGDGIISGIHRKKKESKNIFDREHLGTLDIFGTLRLPKDLIKKAGLKKYIKVVSNEQSK